MADFGMSSLLWQVFFCVAMFLGTFISYLLPIIIYTRKNRRQSSQQGPQTNISTEVDDDEVIIDHQPHFQWNDEHHATSSTLHFDQSQKTKLKLWLSYCNCISAGVFLGVCFLSLVPCVEDEFSKLIQDYPSLKKIFGSFALGQSVVICGLFLVLFLENLLSGCFKSSNNQHNHNHHDDIPVLYLDEESSELQRENNDDDILESEELLSSNQPPASLNFKNVSRKPSQNGSSRQQHENHHGHHHHHHIDIGSMANRNDSMFSFFILMFATSIHSLFEGLALGLQSNIKTALHLFIGIILHECLVAIALGLNAVRLQQETIQMRTHVKFAIVFSMNIPFGNVLGILLGYTPGHVGRFISAIFQGFAAGTFIHVTFFELIPEEFILTNHDHQNKTAVPTQQLRPTNDTTAHRTSSLSENSEQFTLKQRKILLLFFGFVIMAMISFIFSE